MYYRERQNICGGSSLESVVLALRVYVYVCICHSLSQSIYLYDKVSPGILTYVQVFYKLTDQCMSGCETPPFDQHESVI